MAANNPITIECPQCKHSFTFDVFENFDKFEEMKSYPREMGDERHLQATIECPKCECLLQLYVILYPSDDVLHYEVKTI